MAYPIAGNRFPACRGRCSELKTLYEESIYKLVIMEGEMILIESGKRKRYL